MEELEELEKVLPEGWVWEAGNKPDSTYWAQAISPEHGGVHSNLWGNGLTLEDALINLKQNVIGWIPPSRFAPNVYTQGHGKPDRCEEHGDIPRNQSIVNHLAEKHNLTYKEYLVLQESDRIRGFTPNE